MYLVLFSCFFNHLAISVGVIFFGCAKRVLATFNYIISFPGVTDYFNSL